jgi:hypothetical protein
MNIAFTDPTGPQYLTCPECGSSFIRQQGLEAFTQDFVAIAFRCEPCGHTNTLRISWREVEDCSGSLIDWKMPVPGPPKAAGQPAMTTRTNTVAAAARAREERILRMVRMEGTRESKYMISLSFSGSHISTLILRMRTTFENDPTVILISARILISFSEAYENGFSCSVNGLVCKFSPFSHSHISHRGVEALRQSDAMPWSAQRRIAEP